MRTVSIALVALLAGCPSDEDDGGGGGGGGVSSYDHPSWLLAGWDHDEGRSGYAEYADYSIVFDRDGTYVWNYAVSVLEGEWRMPGTLFYMDGTIHDLEHSKSCRVITLDGKTYLSRLSFSTGCPSTPATLSAIEKCLVGEFTAGTPNGGTQSYKFEIERTVTEFYDDPGYTSGGNQYTRYGEFKLLANGDIEVTQPGGDPEVRTSVEQLVGMRRSGSVASGCDMTNFTKLGNPGSGGGGGGTTCTLSCGSGDVCAQYGAAQTCCDASSPYWCPDIHACFATAAARDAACATSYYGDPDFGCEAGQTTVTINGAAGNYCSASCTGSGSSCPRSAWGPQGSCLVHLNGSATANKCAISCTDIGTTGGQCPGGMKCTAATNGNGFCVYP
jgi:hypothetical protein